VRRTVAPGIAGAGEQVHFPQQGLLGCLEPKGDERLDQRDGDVKSVNVAQRTSARPDIFNLAVLRNP
jgi:hypothetical protein